MNKYFFNHVNINKKNIHFPGPNFEQYEKEIKKSGGIDLQILGVGHNGHIGFNEPGSSFHSKTRKIKLRGDTRKFNFSRLSKNTPKNAFTMGIKTIMNSKKIILLAFGKEKAEAIAKTLDGKITTKVPASILRKHKNVIFIIDKKAAGKLKQNHDKI
jgi:glucosamine-6-phosphate deaminase